MGFVKTRLKTTNVAMARPNNEYVPNFYVKKNRLLV